MLCWRLTSPIATNEIHKIGFGLQESRATTWSRRVVVPGSKAGTFQVPLVQNRLAKSSIVSSRPLCSEPEMDHKGLEHKSNNSYFSLQLWQVGHLHEFHTSVLVSDRLHLASPELKSCKGKIQTENPLQRRRSYALGQAGDDGHQFLLLETTVEHQRFSPDAALLLLKFRLDKKYKLVEPWVPVA